MTDAFCAAARRLTQQRECRHGSMLFLSRDRFIGRSLSVYGEYSELEAVMLRQLVQPGDLVVEVGANIGSHSVPLAQALGPTGHLLCFEAQRVVHQLLGANLMLNGLFNAQPVLAAVGATRGTVTVPAMDYTAAANFGGVSLRAGGDEPASAAAAPQGAARTERVTMVTLDSLSLPKLNLLKVDVEGMEVEVLQGARQTIGRHRPAIYLENDRRNRSPELIGLLQELGYHAWWHLPPLFNPSNFAGQDVNIFPNMVSINLVCLPADRKVEVRNLRPVTGVNDWWRSKEEEEK